MINIALGFDGNFAPYAATTIKSILLHNKNVTFYLMYDNLKKSDIKKISSMIESHKEHYHWIDMSGEFNDLFTGNWKSKTLYFPLKLPSICKDERVLFLDADTFVLGDLSKFYNQPLDGYYLAAVNDYGMISDLKTNNQLKLGENTVDIKHYFGNINDKNKFSKYGYYVLDSKNKSNLNERQLSRNYEIFYNKNLKSLYDVGSGVKEYSEITLKNNVLIDSWFKYFNISNIDSLNNKIREEYNKGTLDNLIRYSIKNNFEQNCQKFPLHNVIIKDSEFAENPLSQNKESIHKIFIVINDYINNASVNEYSEIYKLLDNLAEGLYENNDIEIKNSYKKILNIIKPYYTKNHKQVENKNLETIKNFQNSANYQILNRNYNLDLLFGTNTLSIDEKMFLFNKKDKIYGIDLYKFLIDNPTNNKTRKQIINNLMLCENADKEAFKLMKKIFINDVNSGNTENLNSNLLNSVLEQIPNIDNTNLITNEDKIKYLQKFPNEELNILLENIKSDWLEKRTEEAFELEAEKYDINARFDKLAEDITVKIDGIEINLYNTINKLTED